VHAVTFLTYKKPYFLPIIYLISRPPLTTGGE